MASSFAAFEPLLANSKRVVRNQSTAQDLIAAYPSLKQTSLSSPPTLTDSERRIFLDLPDVDIETANISAATNLSREQLIDKAVSDPTLLTSEEAVLLKDHFWTPSTKEEQSQIWEGLAKAKKVLGEFLAARKPAYFTNELEAFDSGSSQVWRRERAAQDDKIRKGPMQDAMGWIQHLYELKKPHWGFICLYDAAAQKLDSQQLELFADYFEGFFSRALQYNGSKGIIDYKWHLMSFNSPSSAFAPTGAPASDYENVTDYENVSRTNYNSGAIFRKAFQDILNDPEEYLKGQNVTNVVEPTYYLNDSIAASGFLTNTFLIIDPVCIETFLKSRARYDNMRILAFEADFLVEGRKYIEGYQGYTLMKAEEVGMDEIWKRAQDSLNSAFVSIEDEGDASWTRSGYIRGFTPDSVLGKRFYTLMDARKKAQED